ncbi:MAG: hypothetical protein ACREKH_11655 [Candidatus Rokuibacteriota bacterium]
MARPKMSVSHLHPKQFSTELIARAIEWQNLAAKLEQRADAWNDDAVRWDSSRDQRASLSCYRTQWIAEQARQLAAWLRLASDHLATLGASHLQ